MRMVLAKDDGLGREGWTSGDSDGVGGQNTGGMEVCSGGMEVCSGKDCVEGVQGELGFR